MTGGKINNPIYYPLLASEDINGGVMVKEEFQDIWSRFDALSEDRKDILMSEEMPQKMKLLQDTFGFGDDIIEGMSVLIRWVFFGQVDQQGLQGSLKTILSEVHSEKIDQVLSFIQKEILTIQPKPRVEEAPEEVLSRAKAIVSMPLLQAMSQYEQLGNQLITNERIKIKSQSDPVRPSLVYWIKYYRDELGVGVHDSVLRGNFLFRSENGKRLSVEERERVNLILKSVEENYPLQIDTEKIEIVFPNFATSKKEPFIISSGAKIIKGPEFGAATENEAPAVPRQAMASPRQFATPDQTGKKAALNPYQSGSLIISQNFQPEESLPGTEKGGMRFSSSHVFPAEKEKNSEQREAAMEQAAQVLAEQAPPSSASSKPPVQAPARAASIKPNPFHIRPVSSRSEEAAFKA